MLILCIERFITFGKNQIWQKSDLPATTFYHFSTITFFYLFLKPKLNYSIKVRMSQIIRRVSHFFICFLHNYLVYKCFKLLINCAKIEVFLMIDKCCKDSIYTLLLVWNKDLIFENAYILIFCITN